MTTSTHAPTTEPTTATTSTATTPPTRTTPGPPPADATETAPLEPLGGRFLALLTSTGLANLGDGVVQMGAPLVALTLTRSPGQLALLAAATWLPWLLLGLLGGVVIDRTDRRTAQVVALGVRGALLATGAALALTGHLTILTLVLLVLGYGVTEVFADLAQTALVPDLVPRSRLQAANGRVLATQQVTNTFVGSPLAGGLLALGTGWVLGVPAAMAVIAVVVLLRGIPGRYRAERSTPTRASADVREGVRYVVHHPVLRPFVLAGGVMNMANTAYMAVFLLWAVGPGSQVGVRAEHYALLATLFALGAIGGSLLTERLVRRLPELGVMYVCWGVIAPMLLVPVLVPRVAAIGAVMVLLGATNTIGNTISMSLRQRVVPRELLGRTSGAGRTIAYGLMPVGALLAGVIGEQAGIRPVLVGAAVVTALAALYPVFTVRRATVAAAEAANPDLTPTA
ncbi:MFS transporter [Cellulomonas persica]|uniref:MFS transporter n=1 Tax=Cellulomonas persica TaxID=76861 RepID=A0A510URN9_9CELL|nr:MFS transporter [Cellulomonas persica]GEK17293.1 MFS transporter [Cellulomonas persica]